jgi:hypothetical protein
MRSYVMASGCSIVGKSSLWATAATATSAAAILGGGGVGEGGRDSLRVEVSEPPSQIAYSSWCSVPGLLMITWPCEMQ